jgi:multiple antibiotic resistance protein
VFNRQECSGMSSPFEFALICFTSLFAMINPFGIIPVFKPMTAGMSHRDARAIARRACMVAFLMLVLFAVAGKFLFDFFGISINSLKIVGGFIFFMLGYELLQARFSKLKYDNQRLKEDQAGFEDHSRDIAITPLAIPILCGPGAIANVIILMHASVTMTNKLMLFCAILSVMLINYFGLVGANRLLNVLGDSGNKVMMRIMGMIVMVIAVEFFLSGLKPVVVDIMNYVDAARIR